MFEIQFWNVHEGSSMTSEEQLTQLKAFTLALAAILCTYSHPSIWKLIDGLKISDSKGRKKITEYDCGDDFDQKSFYQKISKRLKNLVTICEKCCSFNK